MCDIALRRKGVAIMAEALKSIDIGDIAGEPNAWLHKEAVKKKK